MCECNDTSLFLIVLELSGVSAVVVLMIMSASKATSVYLFKYSVKKAV